MALGLSAVATGVRLLPLSVTLLAAAVGVPRLFPHASPRRVVRIGFGLLLLGIVVLLVALDQGSGPEVVTWPLLLAGLGIGTLASQLGAITVSAVPDEQSGEVGGIQNTVTNLGASIGTALAGAVLISVLTTTFLGSVASNAAIPKELSSQAQVELSAGVPFVSDADLDAALEDGGGAARHGRGGRGREREEQDQRPARRPRRAGAAGPGGPGDDRPPACRPARRRGTARRRAPGPSSGRLAECADRGLVSLAGG